MLTTPDSGIESHPALKERIRVCNKLHTLLPGTNVTQLLKKASRSVTYNLSSHSALDAESIFFQFWIPAFAGMTIQRFTSDGAAGKIRSNACRFL